MLLAEDNRGDLTLTKDVLKEGKVTNHLHTVEDGEQALAFLHREDFFADFPIRI